MSSHPVPNSIFWECYEPCNLPDMPHSILHTDYEGSASLHIVVKNHREAFEAGAVIQEYLDAHGDEETFFICPFEAPGSVDEYIKSIRDDMAELERQEREEEVNAGSS